MQEKERKKLTGSKITRIIKLQLGQTAISSPSRSESMGDFESVAAWAGVVVYLQVGVVGHVFDLDFVVD